MRRPVGVLAAVVALCAAGCGTAPRAAPDPGPPVWVDPVCPPPPGIPARGGIPDGFAVTWALRCRQEIQAAHGGPAVRITERADTPATELLAALRRPSDPPTSELCPAIGIVPPYVVLVGADGRGLLPALPSDACGIPRPEVLTLLDALPFRTVSRTRVSLPG